MPEDLLEDLETGTPVAESLEHIEALMRAAVRDVGRAVEGMRGSALTFENIWRRIVMDVAKGQTTEIQAARPRLLDAFEKRLALLKLAHYLAQWYRMQGKADVPDPAVLLPEIEYLERMKANVFDRWHTAEDLEDLAAGDYPLTTADLEQVGPQRRPPASFYAEESKPF